MAQLSAPQRHALEVISNRPTFVNNKGGIFAPGTKGVTARTVASLVKAGLVRPNGASRKFIDGRSYRRLVLTNPWISL